MQSFEDYTSKTRDAWYEDDDDVEKVGERVGSVITQEPTVRFIRGSDVRTGTGILSRIKKKHSNGKLMVCLYMHVMISNRFSFTITRVILSLHT